MRWEYTTHAYMFMKAPPNQSLKMAPVGEGEKPPVPVAYSTRIHFLPPMPDDLDAQDETLETLMNELGGEGWEAYHVRPLQNGIAVYYRRGLPALGDGQVSVYGRD